MFCIHPHSFHSIRCSTLHTSVWLCRLISSFCFDFRLCSSPIPFCTAASLSLVECFSLLFRHPFSFFVAVALGRSVCTMPWYQPPFECIMMLSRKLNGNLCTSIGWKALRTAQYQQPVVNQMNFRHVPLTLSLPFVLSVFVVDLLIHIHNMAYWLLSLQPRRSPNDRFVSFW